MNVSIVQNNDLSCVPNDDGEVTPIPNKYRKRILNCYMRQDSMFLFTYADELHHVVNGDICWVRNKPSHSEFVASVLPDGRVMEVCIKSLTCIEVSIQGYEPIDIYTESPNLSIRYKTLNVWGDTITYQTSDRRMCVNKIVYNNAKLKYECRFTDVIGINLDGEVVGIFGDNMLATRVDNGLVIEQSETIESIEQLRDVIVHNSADISDNSSDSGNTVSTLDSIDEQTGTVVPYASDDDEDVTVGTDSDVSIVYDIVDKHTFEQKFDISINKCYQLDSGDKWGVCKFIQVSHRRALVLHMDSTLELWDVPSSTVINSWEKITTFSLSPNRNYLYIDGNHGTLVNIY